MFHKNIEGHQLPTEPKAENYTQDEKQEKLLTFTDRGIDKYEKTFGVKIAEWKGKKVLDIGSGETEEFSRQAAKLGVEVVSVNPELNEQELREKLQSVPDLQRRSVAAKAQNLPFPSDTFDIAIASRSISIYLHGEELITAVREAVRVLKPEGTFYMSGFIEPREEKWFKSWLKENRINFRIKFFTRSIEIYKPSGDK